MPDTEAARRLLLVEDEDKVARSVAKGLREEGYLVTVAGTCQTAEAHLDEKDGVGRAAGRGYDLLLIDWMLPDGDGLQLTRRCRGSGLSAPILILTAKDAISDRVTGLEAGADDYLVKPFAFAELLARVRALLRRSQGQVASVRVGEVEIDLGARTVQRAGQPVPLTTKEFAVLAYLARHLGRPVSRAELLEQVWASGGDITVSANVVDAQIVKLRSKLESPSTPLIHTVWRVGYALGESNPAGAASGPMAAGPHAP